MYTIGQFANKTGVTIRTLHYYDEIGLLPAIVENNGRRFYNDDHLQTIQTILVCKYLDYSLEDIKAVLAQKRPLLESLYEQKQQLLQKRKQLDHMIASMELAIDIHEKTNTPDPTSLLVVIHSLFTIEEQKQYLRAYLSEELIQLMYDYFDANFVELNRRYITLSYEIKDAYKQRIDDLQLRQLIVRFFEIVPVDFLMKVNEQLAGAEIEEVDKWLFTSLFTEEEEVWLNEQMTRLKIGEELFDASTDATALDTH